MLLYCTVVETIQQCINIHMDVCKTQKISFWACLEDCPCLQHTVMMITRAQNDGHDPADSKLVESDMIKPSNNLIESQVSNQDYREHLQSVSSRAESIALKTSTLSER